MEPLNRRASDGPSALASGEPE